MSLLFGVHAHQPVGNFPAVVDDAHLRCYRPFMQTLHRFPEFRFAMHFSGWLLEYLLEKFPQDFALLKTMVARGQVELFGGGDTEPVLAAIPSSDRIGQLRKLSRRLERAFGAKPRGAWLAERVWEATVVPALADCGIAYVTVDDYHFLCSGKSAAELYGYFGTEEDGRNLSLFPISEALRYRLPFSPAPEAVAYIEALAGRGSQPAAIYFDDIEKFGIWPETYEWVYEKLWLEQFIDGVLRSPAISTMSYRDYHADTRSRGVVYLPTTSYIEMNEWTLPPEPAAVYADLIQQAKTAGLFDTRKAFLRGGIWKNFLSRYAEANWMHKRMLGLSRRLSALPQSRRAPAMLDMLYIAQANDAYWHGLFGGLYLPHLRRAVYRAMVELEAVLDNIAPRAPVISEDIDRDGIDEVFLRNASVQAVVKLDGSAAVVELDAYQLRHNFGDTLRRYREHYHAKIERSEAAGHAGDGIASAHDRIAYKHVIAPADLPADARPRSIFVDRLRPAGGEPAYPEYELSKTSADECAAEFSARAISTRIAKRIAVRSNCLSVQYRFEAAAGAQFVTQLNFAMPSCDSFSGRYVYRGEYPCGFGQQIDLDELTEITLDDQELRAGIKLKVEPPARLRAGPHFTVSQSEAGFEKIMQAVTLELEWQVAQPTAEVSVSLEIVPYDTPLRA